MASWIVHLRVAQAVMERVAALCPQEFVVGNIAPDSGVPNADWSAFSPSKDISHFYVRDARGKHAISPELFAERYLSQAQLCRYDARQRSFYLGYFCHLMTDVYWTNDIFACSVRADEAAYRADPSATVWKWKKDWYDLDFLYLRDHPDFEAFALYAQATNFENVYMDEFSADAFALRCRYILDFYRDDTQHGVLDREYPYLTRERMDAFVRDTADRVIAAIGGEI